MYYKKNEEHQTREANFRKIYKSVEVIHIFLITNIDLNWPSRSVQNL